MAKTGKLDEDAAAKLFKAAVHDIFGKKNQVKFHFLIHNAPRSGVLFHGRVAYGTVSHVSYERPDEDVIGICLRDADRSFLVVESSIGQTVSSNETLLRSAGYGHGSVLSVATGVTYMVQSPLRLDAIAESGRHVVVLTAAYSSTFGRGVRERNLETLIVANTREFCRELSAVAQALGSAYTRRGQNTPLTVLQEYIQNYAVPTIRQRR